MYNAQILKSCFVIITVNSLLGDTFNDNKVIRVREGERNNLTVIFANWSSFVNNVVVGF